MHPECLGMFRGIVSLVHYLGLQEGKFNLLSIPVGLLWCWNVGFSVLCQVL